MSATRIQPTAGRDPFAASRVAAYKNLHKKAWSIRALDGPTRTKSPPTPPP